MQDDRPVFRRSSLDGCHASIFGSMFRGDMLPETEAWHPIHRIIADRALGSLGAWLCILASIAAALMVGGCSAAPGRMAWRPPSADAAMEPRVVPPGVAPFDEAVALVSELKYPDAEVKFRQSLLWFQAVGDKDRSAECMFWLGFCQEKQGRAAEARVQYDKVIRDYSGTPASRMAAERMGRLPAAPASPAGGATRP